MSNQYNNTNPYQAYANLSSGVNPAAPASYTNTIGGQDPSSARSVNLGSVGDIITGTVLETGENPVVEMNGTPIKVRSDVLTNVKKGDQIYLRITGNSSSEITLKLVDQADVSVTSRNGAIQTEIMKNTAQFVANLKQTQAKLSPGYQEFSKELTIVSDSISNEEKQKLRQMGIEISSANLAVVKTLLSQMRGQEQEEDLKKNIESIRHEIMLQNPNVEQNGTLRVNDINYSLTQFSEDSSSMLPISEDQTIYLIQNQLPLTMNNLYKAEYAGAQRPQEHTITPEAMNQLRPQMERTIQTAGLPVNGESMQAAQFLLHKGLPLTSDSLQTFLTIQEINANGFSPEQQAEAVTNYLAEQTALTMEKDSFTTEKSFAPEDSFTNATAIDLKEMNLYAPSASQVADQIRKDLETITDDSFFAFANTGLPFTLANLSSYSVSYSFAATYSVTNETNTASALTAHRQLEELRLKMTWEASFTLASEDIRIRTKELTQVVEALKNQERDYNRQQFLAEDLMPGKDQLKLVEDTNTKLMELPGLPAASLAATVFTGSFTIERLHAQGIQAQNSYIQEAQAERVSIRAKISSYETLMTAPRKDMGDSIQKAFRNVDDILNDMQLPVTSDNQRAIRILGYNQMELSMENIEEIKAADQSVQTMLQNLQPSVVLHMVQDGINPLNMPIPELNNLAKNYIQDPDLAEEGKYSEFLQKLDRKGVISAEDRKGYIGIYRLLDKVVKSKGKDIGTVVRNGQELTLQNLLTAHRSNRSTGMDTLVDESFGGIDTTNPDTSISDAITSAVHNRQSDDAITSAGNRHPGNDAISSAGNHHPGNDTISSAVNSRPDSAIPATNVTQSTITGGNTNGGAGLQYHQGLTEQLFNRITPELIDRMTEEAAEGKTLEEFFDQIKDQITDELDDERAAGGRTPSETTNLIDNSSLNGILSPENSDILQASFADFEFLQTMHITPSITNLAMTRNIRQGNSQIYDSLSEASEEITEQLEHMEDHLTSAEAMEQAYVKLEEMKTAEVHESDDTGEISSLDIQSLKMIRSGLKILQKTSKENYFQIPFSVNGEWNVINLSIIDSETIHGNIRADVHTKDYGTITATLQWNSNHWEGSYSSDTTEGSAMLRSLAGQFEQGLEEITRSISPAANTSSTRSDVTGMLSSFAGLSVAASGTLSTPVNTTSGTAPNNAELYDMSKKLVLMIKHIMQE